MRHIMRQENCSEVFTIRLPRRLREHLEKLAAREGRSVGDVVRRLCEGAGLGDHMKLSVVLSAEDWSDPVAGGPANYRRNKFAAVLRAVADAVQIGSWDGVIEHDPVSGTFRLDMPSARASGAA